MKHTEKTMMDVPATQTEPLPTIASGTTVSTTAEPSESPAVLAVSTNLPHGLDLALTPRATLFSLLDEQQRRSDLLTAVLACYTYLHGDFLRTRSADFLSALETFPAGEFEAYHLSFLSGILPTMHFPRLFADISRLCTADERLYWAEGTLPSTSSLACERLIRLTTRAMQQRSCGLPLVTHSPESRSVKLLARMEHSLRQAGYTDLAHRSILIDVSAGTAMHHGFVQAMRQFMLVIRPSLLRLPEHTQEVQYALEEQAQKEMAEPDFQGDCTVHLLCAHPPREETHEGHLANSHDVLETHPTPLLAGS